MRAQNDTWDDLELFVEKGSRLGNPMITIGARSQFLFNAAFFHTAELTDYDYVILQHSKNKKAITFQFTSFEDALGALRLVKRGPKQNTASVGSKPFFYKHGLVEKEVEGQYSPERVNVKKIGFLWAIYLDEKK